MEVNVTFEENDTTFAADFDEHMSLMGPAGKSAYQIAVDNGYEGTEKDWLASLKGADGEEGERGREGDVGPQGIGIDSVTSTTTQSGNRTVTIRLTDGKTHSFPVPKGTDGVGISSVTSARTGDGKTVISIKLTNGTTSQFIIERGERGPQGEPFKYEDFTEEQLDALTKGIDGSLVRVDENGKIPVSVIPDGIGGGTGEQIQPDWNEVDETSPAYVNNKTHGYIKKSIGYTFNSDGSYVPINAEKDHIAQDNDGYISKLIFITDELYTVAGLLGSTIQVKKIDIQNNTASKVTDVEITSDKILSVSDATFAVVSGLEDMGPSLVVVSDDAVGIDVGGYVLPQNRGTYLSLEIGQDDYVIGSVSVSNKEIKPLDEKFLPKSVMNFLRSLGYTS